jgi:hypothetical protein
MDGKGLPTTTVFNSLLLSSPITLNTSFNLPWVPLYMLGYALQCVWTGTPTGYFQLQGSADPIVPGSDIIPAFGPPFAISPKVKNPVNYDPISSSQYAVVSYGSNTWNVSNARYNFVRLIYVDQSGGSSTAQLTWANLNQKGPS